jgi:hypothetical protein
VGSVDWSEVGLGSTRNRHSPAVVGATDSGPKSQLIPSEIFETRPFQLAPFIIHRYIGLLTSTKSIISILNSKLFSSDLIFL